MKTLLATMFAIVTITLSSDLAHNEIVNKSGKFPNVKTTQPAITTKTVRISNVSVESTEMSTVVLTVASTNEAMDGEDEEEEEEEEEKEETKVRSEKPGETEMTTVLSTSAQLSSTPTNETTTVKRIPSKRKSDSKLASKKPKSTAREQSFAFMVSLQDKDRFHFCSAILINPIVSMTSCLCLTFDISVTSKPAILEFGTPRYKTYGVAGRRDQWMTGEERVVFQGFIHPLCTSGMNIQFDVGAVKFNRGFKLNDMVKLAPLLEPQFIEAAFSILRYEENADCVTAGWGEGIVNRQNKLYNRSCCTTSELKFQSVRILNDVDCSNLACGMSRSCGRNKLKGKLIKSKGMFCAQPVTPPPKGCQGDAGSPLLCTYNGRAFIFGMSSAGHLCSVTQSAEFYSKMDVGLLFLRKMEARTSNGANLVVALSLIHPLRILFLVIIK